MCPDVRLPRRPQERCDTTWTAMMPAALTCAQARRSSSWPREGADVSEIIPGAEPMSVEGGPVGVLVLHGFTGNPQSMRPLAEGFAAAGYSVEMPLLTGHGTVVEDMLDTTWADWSADAEAAYQRLAARTETVVVAGLSMGGSLTLWLATQHPELPGIICVNPATQAAVEVRD